MEEVSGGTSGVAAPAHHDFQVHDDGGPAVEASLSHPAQKMLMDSAKNQTGLITVGE